MSLTIGTHDLRTSFHLISESPLAAAVSFCPRCRGDHVRLPFIQVANAHHGVYFAICPATAQPVLWELPDESPPPDIDWTVGSSHEWLSKS